MSIMALSIKKASNVKTVKELDFSALALNAD